MPYVVKKHYNLNRSILTSEVQQFLKENAKVSPAQVALKKSPFDGISSSELAEQIDSSQRLRTKLPTWLDAENTYYPPRQNAEQCSSEATAQYKANLVSGKSTIDLTGGFGVDAWAFAQNFEAVTYCEMNEKLFPIVKNNFEKLGCENIFCEEGDSIFYLQNSQKSFDLIFLDPARRDEYNRKMVSFSDCIPDIVEHQDLLFERTSTILVKASPMMDISLALEELKGVKEIHVVALKNECKELLFILEKGFEGEATIIAVNLKGDKQEEFSFKKTEEQAAIVELSLPSQYLYEPNTAVLKSGAFNALIERYSVKKLHTSTHLYTSEQLIDDFPGKIYKIAHNLEYNKKAIARQLPHKKANIKTYNFANTPQQMQKKLGLKDGGDTFVFGVKTMDEKYRVLIGEMI